MNEGKNKGITLIALVITIIILLILAGVSIQILTSEDGVIGRTIGTKTVTEIAEEKELLAISVKQAQIDNNGILQEAYLKTALNENTKKDNKAELVLVEEGRFIVQFASGRYYEIDENLKVNYVEEVTGKKTLTVKCIDSNSKELLKREYTILSNTFSKILPQVDGYESSVEKIEGDITEDKTITVLYYLILDDDTELVFSGINSSGNITTNENEIVSYMIGDGGSANNALTQKGKSVQTVLKAPDFYKGKPVTQIGKSAFQNNTTVKKAYIAGNIEKIGNSAFHDAYGLTELVLGEKVNSIGTNGFTTASYLKKVTFKCKMNSFGTEFTNTSRWTEIGEESNNDFYKVIDNVLYSADGKTLIIVPRGKSNVTIAEGTEKLGDGAFNRCYNILSVEIPDSIETIGALCFGRDSQIKSYIIGSNVKNVANMAFHMDSSQLSNLYIKSSTVAKSLTTQDSVGKLIKFGMKNIYFDENINISEIGKYVTDTYNLSTSDKEGYIKYVKK